MKMTISGFSHSGFSRWLAVFAIVAFVGCSHYPGKKSKLFVSEAVFVSAPTDVVWDTVGDYYNLHGWHPAVSTTQMSEKKDVRILILKGSGAKVYEKLTNYKKGKRLSYDMTDVGPFPVKDYSSTITVRSEGDGSRVTWVADFNAADGIASEKAVATMSSVFRAGLDNLPAILDR